jgi:hypothetical protein
VRASFARQLVMGTLGIGIVRLEPGAIELVMPFHAGYTWPAESPSGLRLGRCD